MGDPVAGPSRETSGSKHAHHGERAHGCLLLLGERRCAFLRGCHCGSAHERRRLRATWQRRGRCCRGRGGAHRLVVADADLRRRELAVQSSQTTRRASPTRDHLAPRVLFGCTVGPTVTPERGAPGRWKFMVPPGLDSPRGCLPARWRPGRRRRRSGGGACRRCPPRRSRAGSGCG